MAFDKGKIGIRYGVGGSRGMDQKWYYTEGALTASSDDKAAKLPIVGRRYRIKGYYDYKPQGGAPTEAWVQFLDNGGVNWHERRQFAEAHDIAIGFGASEVVGMRARGDDVHESTTLEGYIYGWGFGYADGEEAARDVFE